jgi:hypothetical protein
MSKTLTVSDVAMLFEQEVRRHDGEMHETSATRNASSLEPPCRLAES